MKKVVPLLLLLTILLTACGPAANAEVPTETPQSSQSIINTAVAATLASVSTEVAGMKATAAAPTATAEKPTEAKPETAKTPAGTPTAAAHTAGLCDFAAFVSDINIPDGTMIPPNTQFSKTWAVKNTGSCTWTPEYSLVWVGGEPMGSPLSLPLTDTNIAPGQTANITIKFTAPPDTKLHSSFWKFRNAKGGMFGVIDATNKETPIWVQIRSGNVYSFMDNMCLALWKTGGGDTLKCPGDPSDVSASVYRLNSSVWQGGTSVNNPVIVVQPPPGEQTTIVGQFPQVIVPEWSNFNTSVGCLNELPNCSGHIKITYSISGGPEQVLHETDVATEGFDVEKIHINLAKFGVFKQPVSFLFYVTTNGEGLDNKIFFYNPNLSP